MLKVDRWIRQMQAEMLAEHGHGMIEPFVAFDSKPAGMISYGLDSTGYDIRLQSEYKVMNQGVVQIDPRNPPVMETVGTSNGMIIIPPNSFVQVTSLEKVHIPDDIQVRGVAKSTYARNGLVVNLVDTEPGYEGYLTFALVNATNKPFVVYPDQGVASLKFHTTDGLCEKNYAKRGGKYQGSDKGQGSKI